MQTWCWPKYKAIRPANLDIIFTYVIRHYKGILSNERGVFRKEQWRCYGKRGSSCWCSKNLKSASWLVGKQSLLVVVLREQNRPHQGGWEKHRPLVPLSWGFIQLAGVGGGEELHWLVGKSSTRFPTGRYDHLNVGVCGGLLTQILILLQTTSWHLM